MSMTSSMCRSMTGRPTHAQNINEQRRQNYSYVRVANEVKNAKVNKPVLTMTSEDGKYSVDYVQDKNGNLVDEWETLMDKWDDYSDWSFREQYGL